MQSVKTEYGWQKGELAVLCMLCKQTRRAALMDSLIAYTHAFLIDFMNPRSSDISQSSMPYRMTT